jgi:catechol 2,3-dioxygenase-like lactoylglutathione lyase family enzyme
MSPFSRITVRQNLRVFDHVTIRVRDLDASRRFYALALGEPTNADVDFTEWGDFGIAATSREKPATRRLHVGFGVRDRRAVEEWWRRLTSAGYQSDGEPGERPQYSAQYYGAFVLDPDGNSIEAVHHETTAPQRSIVDHLWLRTRSVADAKRFYETVAPVVGIRTTHDAPDRVQFSDGVGSFSFVDDGDPTENVHLAFGVADGATVEAFHRVATDNGYVDNGAPGERPRYHAGYHGAFVLDADAHNVEAVFHDRSGA